MSDQISDAFSNEAGRSPRVGDLYSVEGTIYRMTTLRNWDLIGPTVEPGVGDEEAVEFDLGNSFIIRGTPRWVTWMFLRAVVGTVPSMASTVSDFVNRLIATLNPEVVGEPVPGKIEILTDKGNHVVFTDDISSVMGGIIEDRLIVIPCEGSTTIFPMESVIRVDAYPTTPEGE